MFDLLVQLGFYLGLAFFLFTGHRWAALIAAVCALVLALMLIV